MTAIRIVRGNPTDDELAALLAVLLAQPATIAPKPRPARAGWPAASYRSPLTWR
jgi:hypothetical protein